MKTSFRRRLLAACLIASCGAAQATGYHSANNLLLGWMGGYWETKGPGELTKVIFSGNNFSSDKIKAYLLYRCAEVAKAQGKEYFAFYKDLPSAVRDVRSAEKEPTYSAGKPSAYAYILTFDANAPGLLSASEVLQRLKPEID